MSDIYSISSQHYLNSGEAAVDHFCQLLNAILENVDNYALTELNSVYAIVLHKAMGRTNTQIEVIELFLPVLSLQSVLTSMLEVSLKMNGLL